MEAIVDHTGTWVLTIIAAVLGEYDEKFDPATVTPEARLIEDLGVDSLDVLDIKVKLEDAFGVELDYLDDAHTVADIINHIKERNE